MHHPSLFFWSPDSCHLVLGAVCTSSLPRSKHSEAHSFTTLFLLVREISNMHCHRNFPSECPKEKRNSSRGISDWYSLPLLWHLKKLFHLFIYFVGRKQPMPPCTCGGQKAGIRFLLLPCVELGDRTRIVRLGKSTFHLLSHLTGPILGFFVTISLRRPQHGWPRTCCNPASGSQVLAPQARSTNWRPCSLSLLLAMVPGVPTRPCPRC